MKKNDGEETFSKKVQQAFFKRRYLHWDLTKENWKSFLPDDFCFLSQLVRAAGKGSREGQEMFNERGVVWNGHLTEGTKANQRIIVGLLSIIVYLLEVCVYLEKEISVTVSSSVQVQGHKDKEGE